MVLNFSVLELFVTHPYIWMNVKSTIPKAPLLESFSLVFATYLKKQVVLKSKWLSALNIRRFIIVACCLRILFCQIPCPLFIHALMFIQKYTPAHLEAYTCSLLLFLGIRMLAFTYHMYTASILFFWVFAYSESKSEWVYTLKI